MPGGVTGKAREGLPMSIGIGFALVNQYGECDAHLIPFSQWYPHRFITLCAVPMGVFF